MSLDVDDVYRKIGQFGPWQQKAFFQLVLVYLFTAWQNLNSTFALAPAGLKCSSSNVNECPKNVDFCQVRHDGATNSWSFISPKETATAEFSLVCSESWKVPFVSSCYFLGFFFGSGYFGGMGDRFGRKPCFRMLLLLSACCALFSGLAPNYYTYVFFRALTGAIVGGNTTVTYCYCCEFVGPAYRRVLGIFGMTFFAVGFMLLSPVAYTFQHWRLLTIFSGLPFLALYFGTRHIPESPPWLASKDREQEALEILLEIGEANGLGVDKRGGTCDSLAELKSGKQIEADTKPRVSADESSETTLDPRSKGPTQESTITTLTFLRTPVMRVWFVVQVLLWFACSFSYYGLSLGSNASHLSDSLYINVALSGLAELPGYAICMLMIERVGMKGLAVASVIFTAGCYGVNTLVCVGVPSGQSCVQVEGATLLGKTAISMTFAVVFPYSAGISFMPLVVMKLSYFQSVFLISMLVPLVVVLVLFILIGSRISTLHSHW